MISPALGMFQMLASRVICSFVNVHSLLHIPLGSGTWPSLREEQLKRWEVTVRITARSRLSSWPGLAVISLLAHSSPTPHPPNLYPPPPHLSLFLGLILKRLPHTSVSLSLGKNGCLSTPSLS